MLHKAWNSKGEMPYSFPRSSIKFQGHTVQNITDFDPNWAFPDYRPVAAFKSLRFALFFLLNSPPGQNGYHFANIFKRIFLNENGRISIQFSLKFVRKGPIDNKSALVQIMACSLFDAKLLPEPMLTQLTDAYMQHQGEMS